MSHAVSTEHAGGRQGSRAQTLWYDVMGNVSGMQARLAAANVQCK